jgi:hypothetical protein
MDLRYIYCILGSVSLLGAELACSAYKLDNMNHYLANCYFSFGSMNTVTFTSGVEIQCRLTSLLGPIKKTIAKTTHQKHEYECNFPFDIQP